MGRMRSYSQLKGPMLYFRKGSSQMMWLSTREISLPLPSAPSDVSILPPFCCLGSVLWVATVSSQ